MGAADLSRRPIAAKFLYRVLVLANAYKFAELSIPTSINYGYMNWVPK